MIKESKLTYGTVNVVFQVGFVVFLLLVVYTLLVSLFLKLVSGQHCLAEVDGGSWRFSTHIGIFRALETLAQRNIAIFGAARNYVMDRFWRSSSVADESFLVILPEEHFSRCEPTTSESFQFLV